MFTRDLLSKNWIQATISWSISTDILTTSWMALVNNVHCAWYVVDHHDIRGWSHSDELLIFTCNSWNIQDHPSVDRCSDTTWRWFRAFFFPISGSYGILLRWRDQPLMIHGDLTCFRAVQPKGFYPAGVTFWASSLLHLLMSVTWKRPF